MFLTTSGTEANDAALLLATSYRRSNQVLALRNSYHGRSFAHDRDHRQPLVVADEPVAGCRCSYVHGGYRLRSPFRAPRRRRVHRGLRAGPARRHRHVHRAATSPA